MKEMKMKATRRRLTLADKIAARHTRLEKLNAAREALVNAAKAQAQEIARQIGEVEK